MRDEIIREVTDEMIQPAVMRPTGEFAVALFDGQQRLMFSLPRYSRDEVVHLTASLRIWLREGVRRAVDRLEHQPQVTRKQKDLPEGF